ncbi:MAG TPA: translation elongation factor Ts [Gaiellaceae bacterium]|nr:translation elongation factor Ts [Gaiellaceae bacterium]
MTTISADLVKELRERTGAGMMDCKRALQETDGDIDEAIRLLREKGMASAAKRAEHATNEGKVATRTDERRGAIVAVACETEPVSKNDEFVGFVNRLLDAVGRDGADAAARLEQERLELAGRLGENIVIRGADSLEAHEDEVVAEYVHRPAEKIGVLVVMRGTPELARMTAMHISFADPRYLSRDEVPQADVEREREIYEKLPDVVAKPEEVRPRIVEGMLAKRFFAETVLLDQPWIHDTALTVGKALVEHGADVRRFLRLSVAG